MPAVLSENHLVTTIDINLQIARYRSQNRQWFVDETCGAFTSQFGKPVALVRAAR
ncbi:MAG: hypothetical protein WCC22_16665 [Terriglobales bacterium]